jgi:hypothetical protein
VGDFTPPLTAARYGHTYITPSPLYILFFFM